MIIIYSDIKNLQAFKKLPLILQLPIIEGMKMGSTLESAIVTCVSIMPDLWGKEFMREYDKAKKDLEGARDVF